MKACVCHGEALIVIPELVLRGVVALVWLFDRRWIILLVVVLLVAFGVSLL